jgi:hypothetical protein
VAEAKFAVGTAVGVQQKIMRHVDVATTMNVYGKGRWTASSLPTQNFSKMQVWGFVGMEADQESM